MCASKNTVYLWLVPWALTFGAALFFFSHLLVFQLLIKERREEEGSSSNQPELEMFLLALRDMLIEEPMLYLCDSQLLLKAVNIWIGKGGKATLVGALDADILTAAIVRYFERELQREQQLSGSK